MILISIDHTIRVCVYCSHTLLRGAQPGTANTFQIQVLGKIWGDHGRSSHRICTKLGWDLVRLESRIR